MGAYRLVIAATAHERDLANAQSLRPGETGAQSVRLLMRRSRSSATDRLEERVREPEVQEILDRFLAE